MLNVDLTTKSRSEVIKSFDLAVTYLSHTKDYDTMILVVKNMKTYMETK